jgi:hypothetical protein
LTISTAHIIPAADLSKP